MNLDILNLIITIATEDSQTFDWKNMTYQAINLTILLLILVYYLKQPVKNFLIERRGVIRNKIDEAQQAITEARKIHEEYEEKLKHIDDELRNLIETIRKQGKIERDEILRQAEIAYKKIKEEAKETIELETARARRDIQEEAVSSALELAKRIIQENIGESDKDNIIEDFIKKVDEEKWHQSQL